MRASISAFAAFLLVALVLAWPSRAGAEPHFDGRWKQSALSESFTVQTWLNACGEAPKSTTTGGGEIVTMRLEGDELAIIGGGRAYKTNQCYDPMPTLARESHSKDPSGKTWRTRCTTPPNDPRKAILNTLVTATTDTHIDLIETGRYEIVQKEGTCIADVKRTRSFEYVPDVAPTPTQPTTAAPEPKPAPTGGDPKPNACATPGDPSRLEVRPSKKLLKTGESFDFRAVVLDDKGCATRTPTTWKLASAAKGITVDDKGKVTVATDAPEGIVEVVATAAGKDARVTIEVSSPAHYDDLLAKSGLNASGENDSAATAVLGGSAVGAGEGRVEDRARGRRFVFLAIVGGVLVILAIVAVVMMRRSKRAKALEREVEERHEARLQEALERKRKREEQHAAQQRAHEESLEAAESARRAAAEQAAAIAAANAAARAAAAANPPAPAAPGSAPKPAGPPVVDMTCPQCGQAQKSPIAFCPHDGSKLEPKTGEGAIAYPAAAAIARAAAVGPAKRGKICPTCGDRFDANADYCSKDGTHLVLIN